ncbi:UNVERIFIED_CONTAM: hypothetical protein FKN15_070635 [Acipenser sinensis]
MHGSGNKPPGLVPNKFLYMTKDLQRLASYCKVPIQAPSNPVEAMFEKGSLSAMRFVTAVELHSPELTEQVSRELWRRIWSKDQDITTPESLQEAGEKAGLPADQLQRLLGLAVSQEVKEKLKLVTQEALNHKAFGFPLIVVHIDGRPEIFFGSDRFELLAHLLDNVDPGDFFDQGSQMESFQERNGLGRYLKKQDQNFKHSERTDSYQITPVR